ncbi:hypothetical protein V6N12_019238 [Hibiscus sabdariffa]|uniref:Uncharacterized protein n=1 Tax=Hibiscus sabdariffa TaxID=183260 RepID=A0ABR2C719_9ROSI
MWHGWLAVVVPPVFLVSPFGSLVVALGSFAGTTVVALCSFAGSTVVALCSFAGSTVVAPVGRAVLPAPLVGWENAGRAWLGCSQHSCATRSPRFDVGLPCALWPPLVAMVSLMSNGLLEYGKVMYRPVYCMHGSVALLATAWLIWCLAWPADWACYFTVVGIMGGVTVGWCARRRTLMPSFATVLIAALSAESTLSRPVTVVDAVVGCLAWRPSFFSWCASTFKDVVEAIYAEGSMGRPLWPGHAFGSARGLLVVAKGAPLPVLGALGVLDPGVRAGTLAGSVSGHPGGAGRCRGRLPGS